MQRIEHRASFGGRQDVYEHASSTLNCTMRFAIYLPPQAAHGPVPVLYWLSGLTCAEQNFITKAGAQRYAAEHGIAIVAPDTSPRGDNVADAEGYDIGKGAGFYLNATQAPWAACELIATAQERLPLLIDQGGDDEFLDTQLQPHRLLEACDAVDHPLDLRLRPGYDHSYYFISSFIGEHFIFHMRQLSRTR